MCNWNEEAVPSIAKLVELDLGWAAMKKDQWVAEGKTLRCKGNIGWL